MEHNFDSEDLAVFYRSLQLLHSPKIDSQRKLYHLLHQSIRKHHPNSKYLSSCGKKSSDHCGSENSTLKPNDSPAEVVTPCSSLSSCSKRDPRLNKDAAPPIQSAAVSSRDPRFKLESAKTKLDLGSEVIQHRALEEQLIPPSGTISPIIALKSHITPSNFSLPIKWTNGSPISSDFLSNSVKREHPHVLKQFTKRLTSKCPARHSYSPNAVNLKKIRAVLARGDPFPTHLTKACINNITPDLQREKL